MRRWLQLGYSFADAYFGSAVDIEVTDLGAGGGFSKFRTASLSLGFRNYGGGLEAEDGYI